MSSELEPRLFLGGFRAEDGDSEDLQDALSQITWFQLQFRRVELSVFFFLSRSQAVKLSRIAGIKRQHDQVNGCRKTGRRLLFRASRTANSAGITLRVRKVSIDRKGRRNVCLGVASL